MEQWNSQPDQVEFTCVLSNIVGCHVDGHFTVFHNTWFLVHSKTNKLAKETKCQIPDPGYKWSTTDSHTECMEQLEYATCFIKLYRHRHTPRLCLDFCWTFSRGGSKSTHSSMSVVLRSCLELSDFVAAILPTRSPNSAEPQRDTSRVHANKGGADWKHSVLGCSQKSSCSSWLFMWVYCSPYHIQVNSS